MDKATVGKFIASQRKELSLTQKQFADKLGVTDKAVSRRETGKGYPDIETVEIIAEVFGVSVNDVLSGKKNTAEEIELAARQNIIDAYREAQRARIKGIMRTAITALAFCLAICILLPTLYLTVLPNLREGNYILYGDKYYAPVDGRDVPDNFVFFASESGYEGKVIGRDGIDLIRKKDFENVIYNSEIIGTNPIYALFSAKDIPPVNEAIASLTVSVRYLGESNNPNIEQLSKDAKKITGYFEDVQASYKINYSDISSENNGWIRVCITCKEFGGYYIIGDIITTEKAIYYKPLENNINDFCYIISPEEITEETN